MEDVHRTIGSLHRGSARLQLDTTDLCFLVALRARGELATVASFEDSVLVDVFEQVCDLTEPGAPNKRKRATHAIERLREQRLLARVDGAGLVRAGDYAITRLGAAIVDFFAAEEKLTRESLSLLTNILLSQLTEVRAAARQCDSAEDWRTRVIEPLRVTVADLVGGIERRQRGMDAQQEEIQGRIGELLRHDWFGAIEACERLLDETATTLQELNTVLMRDTDLMLTLLQEIEQAAATVDAHDAEAAAHSVAEHVERVSAWGGERQRAWSEYYQYVQRYLRTVVRLDPQRALSQRLRDQIAGWTERPFAYYVAEVPSIRILRELEARVERPPVERPRRSLDEELTMEPPDVEPEALEARVRALLADNPKRLSIVVGALLPGLPVHERFKAVGRIAALVAQDAHVLREIERPWVSVPTGLVLEDWPIEPKELT
jgi:chromosome partition protein MukF